MFNVFNLSKFFNFHVIVILSLQNSLSDSRYSKFFTSKFLFKTLLSQQLRAQHFTVNIKSWIYLSTGTYLCINFTMQKVQNRNWHILMHKLHHVKSPEQKLALFTLNFNMYKIQLLNVTLVFQLCFYCLYLLQIVCIIFVFLDCQSYL